MFISSLHHKPKSVFASEIRTHGKSDLWTHHGGEDNIYTLAMLLNKIILDRMLYMHISPDLENV